MTTEPRREPLSVHDFPLESPALALVQVRREIEQRLSDLERVLIPTSAGSSPPGKQLVRSGLIPSDLYDAIQRLLDATNPAVHGREVNRSVAAVIVDTAVDVLAALDSLHSIAEQKIESLPATSRPVYRFLELPVVKQRQIAAKLGIPIAGDKSYTPMEIAVQVFRGAREDGHLDDLLKLIEESRNPK